MITRRRFLSTAIPAMAAVRCSQPTSVPDNAPPKSAGQGTGAPPLSSAPGLKLVAANFRNLCNISFRVARERGFFSAAGLDVDLFPADVSGGHQHTAGWVAAPSGSARADITVLEYPALADIAAEKLDYYVVAGEHSGCRQLIVPANSRIQSLADLKGRRIGLPPFNDQVMWEYLARQAGLAPDSLQFVPVTAFDAAFIRRQFESGALDAFVTADPVGEILKVEDNARLLASNTWTSPLSGWYCRMIAVRREVLDAHPEVAGGIVRAYRQSAQFIEQNPADAVALAVNAGDLPRDTRQDIYARLLGEYVWTATGRIQEDLERYFRLLIEAGRLPSSSVPRELVKRVYRAA